MLIVPRHALYSVHQLRATAALVGSTVTVHDKAHAEQEKVRSLGLPLEAGAVPALPQLFKCRCFMDAALAQDEVVYINAGEHQRLLSMLMREYKDLVGAVVLSFAHEIDSNIRCAAADKCCCLRAAVGSQRVSLHRLAKLAVFPIRKSVRALSAWLGSGCVLPTVATSSVVLGSGCVLPTVATSSVVQRAGTHLHCVQVW